MEKENWNDLRQIILFIDMKTEFTEVKEPNWF